MTDLFSERDVRGVLSHCSCLDHPRSIFTNRALFSTQHQIFFSFNCDNKRYQSRASSGSSGRVRGGAEKHEIYVAAFGGHLFYDLFLQGQGGHGPPWPPPGSATAGCIDYVNVSAIFTAPMQYSHRPTIYQTLHYIYYPKHIIIKIFF